MGGEIVTIPLIPEHCLNDSHSTLLKKLPGKVHERGFKTFLLYLLCNPKHLYPFQSTGFSGVWWA